MAIVAVDDFEAAVHQVATWNGIGADAEVGHGQFVRAVMGLAVEGDGRAVIPRLIAEQLFTDRQRDEVPHRAVAEHRSAGIEEIPARARREVTVCRSRRASPGRRYWVSATSDGHSRTDCRRVVGPIY